MRSVKYKSDYLKRLRNVDYAKALIKSAFDECLEDDNWQAFGLLLQDIIEARGSKNTFAKKANISRQHLYRLFGKNANPRLSTLAPLFANLGLKLTLSE